MKKLLFLFAFLLIGATAAEAQLISYSQTTRTKEKKKLKPIEPGYQQTVALTAASDMDEFISAGVVYEGGYRFNNTFYLGVGVGFEYYVDVLNHQYWYSFDGNSNYSVQEGCYMGDFSFPLYVTMRIYMSKKRFQPYFSILAGGKFGAGEKIEIGTTTKNFEEDYSTNSYLLEPGFGFDWRLSNKVALNFCVGYSLQCSPQFEGDKLRGKITYPSFSPLTARLGLTF